MADITKAVGAGVMVIAALATIAGVYQLLNRSRETPPKPVVQSAPAQTPAPRATQHSAVSDAEARRVIEEHRASIRGQVRCVGGVLFAIEDEAWTNVGRC